MQENLVQWYKLIHLFKVDRSGGRESRWFCPNVLKEWTAFHKDTFVRSLDLLGLEELRKVSAENA